MPNVGRHAMLSFLAGSLPGSTFVSTPIGCIHAQSVENLISDDP
jgi:hypothetical protein